MSPNPVAGSDLVDWTQALARTQFYISRVQPSSGVELDVFNPALQIRKHFGVEWAAAPQILSETARQTRLALPHLKSRGDEARDYHDRVFGCPAAPVDKLVAVILNFTHECVDRLVKVKF